MREQIALNPARQNQLLQRLIDVPCINEAAILSTCNRTEIYCDTSDPTSLVPWLAREHQLPSEILSSCFYIYEGNQGIRHTLRVASGLDSMMLGEPQILGQMKKAYQQACTAGTIKRNLRNVFEYVFSASKRVRNLSGIGSNPVSIAYAGVQLINQRFNDPTALRVFLIGSGETATLVAKYLYKYGVRDFHVASRTQTNAQILAESLQGKALTISEIPHYLSEVDVVISATTCPLPFINKNLVQHAIKKRPHEPMFFLDLAVPRDIEANVSEIPNVTLYDLDDLQFMIEEGMQERRGAALQAEQLIDGELDNYIRWHRSLKANHVICDYRHQMKYLAEQELQRAVAKLSAGGAQSEVLQEFCDRLLNKLTHQPTVGLKQMAFEGREELFDLIQYLFNTAEDSILV